MVAVEHQSSAAGAAATADAIPLTLRRGDGSPCQVFAVALIGAILLALFASRDLSAWLNGLDAGPILAPVQHAAAEWDGAMANFGLTRPHEALRAATRRALEWEWPGI